MLYNKLEKYKFVEKNNNYLINGDCLEVMKLIDDKSIDMILCDLPYGTTKCKWDAIIDLDLLWIEYERIIKDNGVIALTAQTPFDKILGCSNLPLLRYEWIWEKTQATGHLNAKKMPMKAHENILIFYKKTPIYNPIKTMGHERKVSKAKNRIDCIIRNENDDTIYGKEYIDRIESYDSTERYPRSVIKFKSDKQIESIHKTQKPIALGEYLINTYTNENMLILDNTTGSGSFCISAFICNRNFIGIELDEEIYNSAYDRMKKYKIY